MCKSGSAFCSLQKHASSKAMSGTHCQQKLLMLWPHYTTLGVIRALPCCYTTQLSVLYWEFYHCCSFNATWLISNRHDKINKARHCIRMTPPEQLQLFIRWFAALIISWISKEDTVTCRKAFACVFCQKNKQYCKGRSWGQPLHTELDLSEGHFSDFRKLKQVRGRLERMGYNLIRA